jgi:kynurenine formamidase
LFYRDIIGIAVDTPSTDRGQSRDFRTHQVLGEHNLWGIENLANAEALPPNGSIVYNMVDYLKDGSGAPSRVFAVVGGAANGGSRIFDFDVLTALLCGVFTVAFKL